MNKLNVKLKNLASRAREKVQGFVDIPFELNIFTTLYTPIEENGEEYQIDLAREKRLEDYLNSDIKGEYTYMKTYFTVPSTKPELIDPVWVDLQNKYISSLPKRDILTCCGYSYVGDTIINSYITGKFDITRITKTFTTGIWYSRVFPFFAQMIDTIYKDSVYNYVNYEKILKLAESFDEPTWYKIFDLYILDLQRIISKTPKLTKQVTVWRGAQSTRMFNYKKANKDIYNTTTQFNSTTLSLPIAQDFMGKSINGVNCCMLQINLLKGSRVLLMAGVSYVPEEYELLINIGNKYLVKESKILNISYPMMVTKLVLV